LRAPRAAALAPIRATTRPCDLKSRTWIYTLNNPLPEEYDTFRPGDFGQHQEERGHGTPENPEGTLHLQGVCYFKQPKTLAAMKKIHSRAKWIIPSGNLEHQLAYTSKEDTRVRPPVTWGEKPNQGKRTDLHDVAELISATSGTITKKLKVAAEANPSAFIRYHRGFAAYAAITAAPERKLAPVVWREWQKWLLRYLQKEADDRTILWVTDKTGGQGKSTIVQYLITNYPEDYILLGGKVDAMAYAYDGQAVVFFDVPRTQLSEMDYLYYFAEQLKNGSVFSTKYESRQKTFKSPHVVFFANAEPATGKWSADRLLHLDLEQFTAYTRPVLPFVPPAPVDNDNILAAHLLLDEEGDELSQIMDDETVVPDHEFHVGG